MTLDILGFTIIGEGIHIPTAKKNKIYSNFKFASESRSITKRERQQLVGELDAILISIDLNFQEEQNTL